MDKGSPHTAPHAMRGQRVEPSHAVLEAAAEWYARLCSQQVSEQDRTHWQRWLQADPQHRQAWLYVEDISGSFGRLQDTADPRQTSEHLLQANSRIRRRRQVLKSAAGMVITGMAGWVLVQRQHLPEQLLAWSADHRTGTGELRNVTLPDGTQVWLNTNSAINVDYSDKTRRIVLVTGEIFIATAADPTRPFWVSTDQGNLRALGTRFNVRHGAHATLMSVYEGAVQIVTRSGRSAVIPAGQQAEFTDTTISAAASADLAREAWSRGILMAHDIPLADFVAELRRHAHGHIGVDDEIAGLRVFGNFPLNDMPRTLSMLTRALPVRVRQPLPFWTTLAAAPASE